MAHARYPGALPLALLVTTSAFTGCMGFVGDMIGGHCGPTSTVEWHAPGLFDALPDAAARVGADVEELPPREGLPFEAPNREGVRSAFSLTRVAWIPWGDARASDGRSMLRVELTSEPETRLTVGAPPNTTADEIRHAAARFLENVSAADADTQSAWLDALVASRAPMGWGSDRDGDGELDVIRYQYTVALTGPFRLTELYADAESGDGNHTSGPQSPGTRVELGPAGYAWTFALGERTLRVDTPQGPLSVRVDGADQARVAIPGGAGAGLIANVTAAFARMELPPPDVTAEDFDTMIC